jgi:hypothetical protein
VHKTLQKHLTTIGTGRDFLKDNIYQSGRLKGTELKLLTQLHTLKILREIGIFIPGNHDWARGVGV